MSEMSAMSWMGSPYKSENEMKRKGEGRAQETINI